MTGMYWTPRKVSRQAVVGLAILAMLAIFVLENFKTVVPLPRQAEKVAAAQLTQAMFDEIKAERIRRGYTIDPMTDPTESGLIGATISPITSITGYLESKQTSVNANFAAVLVDMLDNSGVERGDTIAVGYSGSFPALNAAVCGACEALEIHPIMIASAAASQYGANLPEFVWLDMERHLNRRELTSIRSMAASLGGYEDRAEGMDKTGHDMLLTALQRNSIELLDGKSFVESIDLRMQVYERLAKGKPIKAYINVGGGTVSVGRSLGKHMFRPGLNQTPPRDIQYVDSVMSRFILQGTPVVHLVNIKQIAADYGLPIAPIERAEIGQANVYTQHHYNRTLALVLLVIVGGGYPLFALTPLGSQAESAEATDGCEEALQLVV